MLLVHFSKDTELRLSDFNDVFCGKTAILVGASPSLNEENIELLNKRGVLSVAMNNAAMHFQPTLWCSGDAPHCYDPQILMDPRIIKFAPFVHFNTKLDDGSFYFKCPNIHFFYQKLNVFWADFFDVRKEVPWYHNTFFTSINLLYNLGIRRIVLAGSDFGAGVDKELYAHPTVLSDKERNWNTLLYDYIVDEMKALKSIFDDNGLEILDASRYSRLSPEYTKISFEEGIELCLSGFPEKRDSRTLPHCAKILDNLGNGDLSELKKRAWDKPYENSQQTLI